jgi:hypothetical protein
MVYDLERLKQRIPLLEYLQCRNWRHCRLSGVNYFFYLTTIISPYRVASPINVTELVDVVVCLISWGAEPLSCLAQRQRSMDFWSR